MTAEDTIGIGAATEPVSTFADDPPHVRVYANGSQIVLACILCVCRQTLALPRGAGELADDLAHFARQHALCERGRA